MKSILRSIFYMPGVVSHELSHHIFCVILNVKVINVCYYNFKDSSGYVLHNRPKHLYQNILISTAPFFLNTFLGALISYSSIIKKLSFSGLTSLNWQDLLKIIISISVGMKAIPSKSDGLNIWNSIGDSDMNLIFKLISKLIIAPLVIILLLINFGSSHLKIDLFYGVCVCFLGPKLLNSILNLEIILQFLDTIQNTTF